MWGFLISAALVVGTIVSDGFRTTDSSGASKSFVAPLNVYPIPIINVPGQVEYELMAVIGLEIGTPPQTVYAAFDTGSEIPVIYNKSCTMSDCGAAVKYDTAKSSTAQVDFGFRVHEDYGAGNTSGFTALDNFSFPTDADGVASNWIENFTVINSVHWLPGNAGLAHLPTSSGIFGMGPTGTGPDILVKKYGIDMVAVRMPRGEPFTNGVAQFGGYDRVNPELKDPVWTNRVAAFPGWFITIDDVLVDGVSTMNCPTPGPGLLGCVCLMDTGAEMLKFEDVGVPSRAAVNNISCDKINTLPTIGVVVKNHTFTLHPQDYILKLPDGTCQSSLVVVNDGVNKLSSEQILKKRYTTRRVYGKEELVAAAGGEPMVMAFDIQWMSRVTTIFDWKLQRVGLIEHQ